MKITDEQVQELFDLIGESGRWEELQAERERRGMIGIMHRRVDALIYQLVVIHEKCPPTKTSDVRCPYPDCKNCWSCWQEWVEGCGPYVVKTKEAKK